PESSAPGPAPPRERAEPMRRSGRSSSSLSLLSVIHFHLDRAQLAARDVQTEQHLTLRLFALRPPLFLPIPDAAAGSDDEAGGHPETKGKLESWPPSSRGRWFVPLDARAHAIGKAVRRIHAAQRRPQLVVDVRHVRNFFLNVFRARCSWLFTVAT